MHAELTRKGPALLLRDIEAGKDAQLIALGEVVDAVDPDVLLLTKVDFDMELRTSDALRHFLDYPHMFALAPNSMRPTQLDLDGDGRGRDRQVWARYAGEGAMLLLSRYPVTLQFHLNELLWKDATLGQMPVDENGKPFPSAAAKRAQKLVGQGLWVVEIETGSIGAVSVVAFQNQAPVFDGPEDMNGLRSHAQLGLLGAVLDSDYGAFPTERFVLLGNTNLDPDRGEGDRDAMAALLADDRLQDSEPRAPDGNIATAYWDNPGPMRVSYALPSWDWIVQDVGVFWPKTGPLRKNAEQASRHRMVWVDLTQPP